MRELLLIRRPLYQQIADIRVDTSSLTINEVAEIIVQRIEEQVIPTARQFKGRTGYSCSRAGV